MTRLIWDALPERLFETGIERGVLYLPNLSVVWNGLIGVDEDFSEEENEPLYYDGVKYLDAQLLGDFRATLKAFTYPDEFLECEGVTPLTQVGYSDADGAYFDYQDPIPFGLSYRTLVGNGPESLDYNHYKLHLVYNATIDKDDVTYETVTETQTPIEFSWQISAVPEPVTAEYRPTAHVIFDTQYLDPGFVVHLEERLYGTPTSDPYLPSLKELMLWAPEWCPDLTVWDHGDGTWSAQDNGLLITMLDATTFQIDAANVTYLDADTYEIRSNCQL